MANDNHKKIDPALLDEFLKNQDSQSVFSSAGGFTPLPRMVESRVTIAPVAKWPSS